MKTKKIHLNKTTLSNLNKLEKGTAFGGRKPTKELKPPCFITQQWTCFPGPCE